MQRAGAPARKAWPADMSRDYYSNGRHEKMRNNFIHGPPFNVFK